MLWKRCCHISVLQLLFIEPYLTENHHLDLQLHLLSRITSTLLIGSFPPSHKFFFFLDTANRMTTG